MKTKPGFHLREICGESVVIAEGITNIDFNKIISMNESSAFLWEKVSRMADFDEDTLVDLLTEEYEVDRETAAADVHTLIEKWQEAGLIE